MQPHEDPPGRVIGLAGVLLLLALPHLLRIADAATLSEHASFATASGSGGMLGSVAVGEVDGDPELEIVVNSGQGIAVFDHDGTPGATFSTHNGSISRQVNAPPSLYDVDGDGRLEIVFATGSGTTKDPANVDTAYAINGEDGSIAWQTPLSLATYSSPDSGYQTIEGYFYYSGGLHTQLPASSTMTASAPAAPVADIDGDGAPEVVVNLKIDPAPVQDYNPYIDDIWGFADWGTVGESWSGGNLVLDAATGARSYIYHFVQLSEAGLALGRLRQGKDLAVFCLIDADAVVAYHRTDPYGFYGAGNLVGQFGKNSRIQSASYKRPVTLNAADIDGDGKVEVLYEGASVESTLWQASRVIFDDDGTILWRRWYDVGPSTGFANHWPNPSQMIPLNLDGGPPEVVSFHHTPELAYEQWDGVELVSKGPAWPVDFAPLYPSPPAVGDVDGDGAEELVVALYDPTDLAAAGALAIVGQNGSIEQTVPTARGLKNTPCLADLDGDDVLEVVVRDLGDTVRVYDTTAGDPGKVSWAAEYHDMQRVGALEVRLYPLEAPQVLAVVEGYERVELSWSMTVTSALQGFVVTRQVYGQPASAVTTTLSSAARSHSATGLVNGVLYIFTVTAVFASSSFDSAPIPAVPLLEGNLVKNSGMELNGDRAWDKWYTGDIPFSAMTRTEGQAHSGNASMQIHLDAMGEASSIKQWNQYGVVDAQLPVSPGAPYCFGAFFKTDLDQTSHHFIEWSSTYDRWRHDPTGDPIPFGEWPFYFSTHVRTPPGQSPWWYSGRCLVMQEGITGIAPRHRYRLDASPVSGDVFIDDVFFRRIATDGPGAVALLPLTSTWRYLDATPSGTWYQPGYDDAGWPLGQAKFGTGSQTQAVATPLPKYRDQFYFRTTFTLDVLPGELVAYGISTTGPDGASGIAEIYLNGFRVPIQDTGLSENPGNEVRMLDLSPFIPLLNLGPNLVAVKLENEYAATWDDVAFDLELRCVDSVGGSGLIFYDGFESGDPSHWSASFP